MAIKFDITTRNEMLQAIKDLVGTAATLVIYDLNGASMTGIDCDDAMPGGVDILAAIAMPNPCFGTPSAGAMSLSGTWEDTSANATGTANYFRIFRAGTQVTAPSDCVMQGTVGESAADMIIDNAAINSGQTVSVTAFTLTAGNTDQ